MIHRIHILVEGQTEEAFVNRVLIPHFSQIEIDLNPIVIITRQDPGYQAHRGGTVAYSSFKKQISRLLGDTSAMAVTMMLDFYAVADSFPGCRNCIETKGLQRVMHLECMLSNDIQNNRFIPYYQTHEFEALLFVSPTETADILGSPNIAHALGRIRQAFPSPEEIDNNPVTAPSALIQRLFPEYIKENDGPLVTMSVGLPVLRQECKHLDNWLIKIEQYGVTKDKNA